MRICVKGLPKNATEAQLRAHFAELGEIITDAKIAKTRAGASRQFAFIGFKTDAAAAAAVQRYNKSFMGTSRLAVEPAADIDDATRVKLAWSRHTKHKEAAKASSTPSKPTIARDATRAVGDAAPKDAVRLKEYVTLATRVAKGPSWANDDALARASNDTKKGASKRRGSGDIADDASDGSSTDSGEYADVPAAAPAKEEKRRAGGAVGTTSKSTVADPRARARPIPARGSAATGTSADSSSGNSDDDDEAEAAPAAAARPLARGVSGADADFLRSHIVRGDFSSESEGEDEEEGVGSSGSGRGRRQEPMEVDDDDEEGEGAEAAQREGSGAAGSDDEEAYEAAGPVPAADAAEGEGRWQRQQQERRHGVGAAPEGGAGARAAAENDAEGEEGAEEGVGESGRLFVRNLPYSATDAEVAAYFGRWGATADVRVVRDGRGRLTGCAYVLYVLPVRRGEGGGGGAGHRCCPNLPLALHPTTGACRVGTVRS
jgi:multiple RNA-binding domain-containing protein 1